MQVREALAATTTPKKADKKSGAVKRDARNDKLFQQGIDFYLEGNWRQAVSVWQQILQNDPKYPQVRDYVAKAQEKLGARKNEAPLDEARLAHAEDFYRQGLLKYRQRQFDEARTLWEQALTVNPGLAEAKRGLERIQAIQQALDKK